MKCAKCDCRIETDEETWVRGEALCPACWKRRLRKTWTLALVVAGAVVAIVFGAPILFFCIIGAQLAGHK
jgi:hypothetical protein